MFLLGLVAELSKDPKNGWKGTNEGIPVGDDRLFSAKAFDESDNVIYQGKEFSVTIDPIETAQVLIVMQQSEPVQKCCSKICINRAFEKLGWSRRKR